MRVGPSGRRAGADSKPPLSCCGKELWWRALEEKASNRCQVSVKKANENELIEEASKGLDDVETWVQYHLGTSEEETCLPA
jgi:hypothetical protein